VVAARFPDKPNYSKKLPFFQSEGNIKQERDIKNTGDRGDQQLSC
jgi:hypothetical protein